MVCPCHPPAVRRARDQPAPHPRLPGHRRTPGQRLRAPRRVPVAGAETGRGHAPRPSPQTVGLGPDRRPFGAGLRAGPGGVCRVPGISVSGQPVQRLSGSDRGHHTPSGRVRGGRRTAGVDVGCRRRGGRGGAARAFPRHRASAVSGCTGTGHAQLSGACPRRAARCHRRRNRRRARHRGPWPSDL